jgi:hypothetical protein
MQSFAHRAGEVDASCTFQLSSLVHLVTQGPSCLYSFSCSTSEMKLNSHCQPECRPRLAMPRLTSIWKRPSMRLPSDRLTCPLQVGHAHGRTYEVGFDDPASG